MTYFLVKRERARGLSALAGRRLAEALRSELVQFLKRGVWRFICAIGNMRGLEACKLLLSQRLHKAETNFPVFHPPYHCPVRACLADVDLHRGAWCNLLHAMLEPASPARQVAQDNILRLAKAGREPAGQGDEFAIGLPCTHGLDSSGIMLSSGKFAKA